MMHRAWSSMVFSVRLSVRPSVRLSVCLSVCLSVRLSVCHNFLAATKQLYDWFSPSLRLSVSPSVCPSVTPFSPCSHHRIIMKFSGVNTNDKSDVHAKGQGQRSKVKVTEVNTQLKEYTTRKKTIFTAIICVYRTFYGLQHQYHTKNTQNRTSPQHLTQFTPTAVAGKNAPPFCLRSLGPDSNACSFYTPVWKTDVLCYGNVRPSVRPSEFSGLFFNVLWDINLKLGICIQ